MLPKLQGGGDRQVARSTAPARRARPPGVHWVKPELVAEIEFAGWTGDGNRAAGQLQGPARGQARRGGGGRDARRRAGRGAGRSRGGGAKPKPRGGRNRAGRFAGRDGRHPLQPRQGAVAGGGRRASRSPSSTWPATTRPSAAGSCRTSRAGPARIIRCPDGIGGERLLPAPRRQGTSALVTVGHGLGRPQALSADRPARGAGRRWRRSGALELHPWNCLPDEPEVPGRLVFDLDPGPDVGLRAGDRGAPWRCSERLEALGLVAFCKTTGGKGLHVVTPLAAEKEPLDWPRPRPSRATSAPQMAADSPDRYLVNMAKAKRRGRIFLDYLRNDRMSTAVAPLSPRARPGAPVSWLADLGAGEEGARPQGLHHPHRARPAEEDQGLGRLRGLGAPAPPRDRQAGRPARGVKLARKDCFGLRWPEIS